MNKTNFNQISILLKSPIPEAPYFCGELARPGAAGIYRFILGIAQRFQVALDAARFSCHTHPASVPNQLVRELNPLISR